MVNSTAQNGNIWHSCDDNVQDNEEGEMDLLPDQTAVGGNHHLPMRPEEHALDTTCLHGKEKLDPLGINGIADGPAKPLVYRVSETPPLHMTVMFGLQQALIVITNPLTCTILLSEVLCANEDDQFKFQLLCSTMFMAGLSTLTMCTFGVRLPIFQGPGTPYLLSLLALPNLDEWKCPRTFEALDTSTNTTILMADMGNGTSVPNREITLARASMISGSLVVAGGVHFLVGISGLVGILIKRIGPVTIVPTLTVLGAGLSKIVVTLSQADWKVAITVSVTTLMLSLFLSNYKTPIPMWNRRRGFHISWYPLNQGLAMLFAMIIGYALSTILTSTNCYSNDPKNADFKARVDSRQFMISETHWFTFPYPGQNGGYSFSTSIFVLFLFATIISLVDSIGDYGACARVARVTHPPGYAFNRGIAVEGLMSMLSGFLGCCHPTMSYATNVGAMSITKVASLRVFQTTGLIYIVLSTFGKFGAVFMTIPNSVLGGIMLITEGMFIGMALALLQTVDLNSTRNVAIIGITIMLGFVVPLYISNNPDAIDTGNTDVNSILRTLLTNPTVVAGVFSCFMDNAVPGTLGERGLLAQMNDLQDRETIGVSKHYQDGPEIYRLPFLSDSFRRSRFAKYVKLFDITSTGPKR